MKPLYDLQQEINRLFIAGSKFAKNDPRLAKHIPVLEKLGEKAPVFKKLAEGVEELTRTESAESADKLLSLGTLLYSVLYTQGSTAEDAKILPLTPSVSLNDINTTASYLELNPVIEALTTTQSGRMSVVEDGFKRGTFKDFRTFEYVNRALGDKYAELADYIEKTVIPSQSGKMLPLLVSTFSYEGRPEDVRRFRLLHSSKYPGLSEMITKILAGSSVALQAEAVRVLGEDVSNSSTVMTLADDKHKPVREAAYQALAQYNTPESAAKLVETFLKNKNKNNLEGITEALKLIPDFSEEVYQKVRADFEVCAAADKDIDEKTLRPPFETLRTVLNTLYGKKDDRILRFFEEVLTHKNFNTAISFRKSVLQYTGGQIGAEIAENLRTLGEVGIKTFERLTADAGAMKTWGQKIVPQYFAACKDTYSAKEMYDTFAAHYKNKLIESDLFISSYSDDHYYGYYGSWFWSHADNNKIRTDKIDQRWIDLFLERAGKDENAIYLATLCGKTTSKKIRTLLSDKLQSMSKDRELPADAAFYIEQAADVEISDYRELIMNIFENPKSGGAGQVSYNRLLQGITDLSVWKKFSKSYEPRFRKLFEKTRRDEFNEIADAVAGNK